jgi:flagellar assembly protein FliH
MSGGFVPFGGGGSSAAPAPFRPLGSPEPAAPDVPDEAEAQLGEELRRAFQAGYEQAREELAAKAETVAESFGKALQELARFRAAVRDRYERELLEVALGVAKKVVQQELQERPEIWLGMIRTAIRRAVERERIVVRLPEALAAFIRERLPELRAGLDDVKELDVVDDGSLPADGCIVESRFGDVDLGVETQIAAARAALLRSEE